MTNKKNVKKRSLIVPDFEYNSLLDIDHDIFSDRELLIFDVDNTVFFSETTESPDEIVNWFCEVNNKYKCIFSSNSWTIGKRMDVICQKTGSEVFISRHKKPSVKLFKKICSEYGVEPEKAAVIGDRIFTDVFFGNRNRAMTVLVKPLATKEYLFIKFFRFCENIMLKLGKFLLKKELQLASLIQQGYTCVDLHTHTEFSKDSFGNIKKYISIAKKKGIGLAISDHNEIDGAVYAVKNNDGVLIIPGIEVKAFNGIDVLVYFYNVDDLIRYYEEYIVPRKIHDDFVLDIKVEEIVDFARKFKCVIVAPHPFEIRQCGFGNVVENGVVSEEIMNKINGIEIINGANTKKRNKKAGDWAKNFNVVLTGGSDAHISSGVGNVVTCALLKDGENFLDAIQRESTLVVEFKHHKIMPIILFILGQFKLLTFPNGWRRFKKHVSTCISLRGRV